MDLEQWMKANGIDASSFKGAMLVALCKADLRNQDRIKTEFPKIHYEYQMFMAGMMRRGLNWVPRVRESDEPVSDYHWTITVDHIADSEADMATNCNARGMVGPRNASMTAEQITSNPDAVKFRMLDDDEEVYYEGYLLGGDGLEPLEDFGTPNAGAVHMEHLNSDNIWETI